MMVDEGWGNGDPRVRLAQLDEALLRECRYVVGVKLHTQGMTSEAGRAAVYRTSASKRRRSRVEESLRGTQDPMYGYYTLGKLMILKLRDDYKKDRSAAVYAAEVPRRAALARRPAGPAAAALYPRTGRRRQAAVDFFSAVSKSARVRPTS